MNWLKTQGTQMKNWWINNHTNIESGIQKGTRGFCEWIIRTGNNVVRMVIIGIIINVIASNFYPEFNERFPVIYGWFDGWLQFGEFALNAGFTGIYSLFTGHWGEFCVEYGEAINELIQQFVNWLGTLHF